MLQRRRRSSAACAAAMATPNPDPNPRVSYHSSVGGALPWGNERSARSAEPVPKLVQLALDSLARRPELIVDLSGTAEHLAIGLLGRLMRAGRLDFRLACVFRESGHEPIREAMEGLDLVSAVPTHNTLNQHRNR